MPSAEIISIGTELLLGEIVDTNAPYLARLLRSIGVDLFRKTTIGDNKNRIAAIIQESLSRCDIIITTGGLGPTVDDPTREAVALAFGVPTEFHPELWEQIQSRFARYGRLPTENNRRQAFIPQGAIAVENPVGTAPAFMVEIAGKVIVALPGVPKEMEYLMHNQVIPFLRQRFDLKGMIKARVIHTAGVGESQIDEMIGDLETLSNPTVGLLAHSGQVDVRITAKADSEADADRMIQELEKTLQERLGDMIYGADQDTLDDKVFETLQRKAWKLAVLEAGLNGDLLKRLSANPLWFLEGKVLLGTPGAGELHKQVTFYQQTSPAEVVLGISLLPGVEKQDLYLILVTPVEKAQQLHRSYGGPPGNAPRWAVNNALNLLRLIP
jgi:nicotinamide-nucleotide amidase